MPGLAATSPLNPADEPLLETIPYLCGGLAKFSRSIALFTPENEAGEKRCGGSTRGTLQEFGTCCGFELIIRDPAHMSRPRCRSPTTDSARMCVLRDTEEEGTSDLSDAVAQVIVINRSTAGANVVAPDVATVPAVLQADDDVGVDVDLTNTADTPFVGEQHHCCENCNVEHSSSGNREGAFCTEGTQGFWESMVAMVTLGTMCGWFYFISSFWAALLVHALVFRSVTTGTFAAVLLSSCWWPLNNRYPNARFINSWIFRIWRRYFQWQCVVEEPLDPSKRYMFAEMPHGIVPLGAVLSVSVVRDTFPGIKHVSGVAADIVLRLPGIRSLYAWMGVRKAGRKSILDMFDDGVQVAVVVGGIAEMFLVSRTEERLYLRKRKSFVRIAVEAGANIVPVYFFGNSLLFDLVGGRDENSWLSRFSRKAKSSFLLFYGRFFTTIPHRQQLKMVAGRPIEVIQSDTPDEAYVDSLHEELIRRVEGIYRDHRPEWEKRELVIR